MSRSGHLVLRIAALALIVACAAIPRHPPRKVTVAQASLAPPRLP